jgi:beta-glucosidase
MTTVGSYPVPSVGYWEDENITTSFNESWKLSETGWGIDANGLKELLIYSYSRYKLPHYITENGLAWNETTAEEAINDVERQKYIHDHIQAVGEAIDEGVDVRGYFVWSAFDNLEWFSGFEMKFGLVWIDRSNNLQRIVKNSMRWYSNFISQFQKLNT